MLQGGLGKVQEAQSQVWQLRHLENFALEIGAKISLGRECSPFPAGAGKGAVEQNGLAEDLPPQPLANQ